MDISTLHPNFSFATSDIEIQEILRSILIRTNLVPGIRHAIGWRGLKDSSHDVEGWTVRIKELPGIFGITFQEGKKSDQWMTGYFALSYFPSPDDDLIDQFSVQAGILAQQDDYLSKIRDLQQFPELGDTFYIGTLILSVNQAGNSLVASLEGLSRQMMTSVTGISMTQNDRRTELVQPGGVDQDFPAFRIAYQFFQVFAASITFNLEEIPVSMSLSDAPGQEMLCNASANTVALISSERTDTCLFSLGYGQQERVEKSHVNCHDIPYQDQVVWQTGELMPLVYQDENWWSAHKTGSFQPESKEMKGVDNRPQLIVVSGFLGSGKTSFLQHFIEYQSRRNLFVAVIQNEIGEIGLDAKLLNQEYAVTEMDEGCVCCTLVGNLKIAIVGILEKYNPDFIILETTGLANPFNLLDELTELSELVRFDTITTLVDSVDIESLLAHYEVAKNQIKAADVLILNKADLISESQKLALTHLFQQLKPNTPVIFSTFGDIDPALLYDPDPTLPSDGLNKELVRSHQSEYVAVDYHHHEHNHQSHETEALSSIKIDFTKAVAKKQLIQALVSQPESIYRIKGVIDFKDCPTPMLVQFVGGRYDISQFKASNIDDRYLIVIGQHLNQNFSPEVFKKQIGLE